MVEGSSCVRDFSLFAVIFLSPKIQRQSERMFVFPSFFYLTNP